MPRKAQSFQSDLYPDIACDYGVTGDEWVQGKSLDPKRQQFQPNGNKQISAYANIEITPNQNEPQKQASHDNVILTDQDLQKQQSNIKSGNDNEVQEELKQQQPEMQDQNEMEKHVQQQKPERVDEQPVNEQQAQHSQEQLPLEVQNQPNPVHEAASNKEADDLQHKIKQQQLDWDQKEKEYE